MVAQIESADGLKDAGNEAIKEGQFAIAEEKSVKTRLIIFYDCWSGFFLNLASKTF